MIDLKVTPEAIESMNDGDVATLGGHVFTFREIEMLRGKCCHLEKEIRVSEIKKYDAIYQFLHVRDRFSRAVFDRGELIELIKKGKYVIR